MISAEVAHRILTRDAPAVGNGTTERASFVLQRSCTRFTDAVCDAMGEAGCAALIARAFAGAEQAHPALKALRALQRDSAHIARLDGIAAAVDADGIEAVTAALEALLGAVIDTLIRLIGEEMTIRLIDHDGPEPRARGGARVP